MGYIGLAAFFSLIAPLLQVNLRALDWADTELEQHAAIGAALAPYTFKFTNNGGAPVTITNVRMGCGCLTSDISHETLAPGESGTLTVHFDRTGLVGQVERTIAVTTDEKNRDKPYALVVRAELPEPLTLAPRLVFWKSGATAATKSIDIKVNLPDGAEITGATANRDDFTIALTAIEPRRRYRLDITPHGTGAPRLAIITIQTAGALPSDTTRTVYAQVR